MCPRQTGSIALERRAGNGCLREALGGPPVGEDRSTGGSGMQEKNGTARTMLDLAAEDATTVLRLGACHP